MVVGLCVTAFFLLLPSIDVGSLLGWEYIYETWLPFTHIGMIVSCLFVPFLLNCMGRRCSYLFLIWMLYAGLALKFVFINNEFALIGARVLAGVGAGFYLQFILVYFSEMAHRRKRGVLLCLPLTIISIFTLVYYLSEPYFPYNLFANLGSGFLAYLGALLFLRESPYFLIAKRKTAKALDKLEVTRCRRYDVRPEFMEMCYEVRAYGRRVVAGCPFCAYQEMLERTLLIMMISFLTMMAFGGQPNYHIYRHWTWYDRNFYLYHIGGVAGGSLFAMLCVDCGGRRFIAIMSSFFLLAAIIAFYVLSKFFSFKFEYPYNEGIINGLYHTGMYFTPFIMMAESYPYVIRPKAVAFHLFFYIVFEQMGCFVNIYYVYLRKTLDIYYPFCAIILFIYFLLVLFLLPELARRTLFRAQVYLDKFR